MHSLYDNGGQLSCEITKSAIDFVESLGLDAWMSVDHAHFVLDQNKMEGAEVLERAKAICAAFGILSDNILLIDPCMYDDAKLLPVAKIRKVIEQVFALIRMAAIAAGIDVRYPSPYCPNFEKLNSQEVVKAMEAACWTHHILLQEKKISKPVCVANVVPGELKNTIESAFHYIRQAAELLGLNVSFGKGHWVDGAWIYADVGGAQ